MHRGEAAVAQAMEETMVDVTPEIKTRIGALWSMANIVTLTGLLGTVTGLINTFGGIGSEVARRGNPASVSDAGVGGACGLAAAEGAALNVRINLPSVGDEAVNREFAGSMTELLERARSLAGGAPQRTELPGSRWPRGRCQAALIRYGPRRALPALRPPRS